jgi:hypothetical protein
MVWGRTKGDSLPLIPSSLQEILLAFGGRNKLLAVIRKVCVRQSPDLMGLRTKEGRKKERKKTESKEFVTDFGLQLFFFLSPCFFLVTNKRNTSIRAWEHIEFNENMGTFKIGGGSPPPPKSTVFFVF